MSTSTDLPDAAHLDRRPQPKPAARSWMTPIARWAPYWLPAALITVVFLVYPIVETFRLSFTEWRGFGDSNWIGFDNYTRLVKDGLFFSSLRRSVLFATLGTVLTMAVGTAMAAAFDQRIAGRRLFQFLIFLPVVLPATFISAAWASGFAPYDGWATALISGSDPTPDVNVLGGGLALYAVIGVVVLQETGFPMVVILGALTKVAPEIHEAATLDGVTSWQRVRHISLPMVKEPIIAMALLQWVFLFGAFEYIFILTNGGPGNATEVTSTFIYEEAFVSREFGYASAAAVLTTFVVAGVVMIYMTALRPRGVERAG